MDYKNEYYQIINRRIENPLSENDGYTEVHHIVPRSLCKLLHESSKNLVRLTAYEHFVAHYFLWKWFEQIGEKDWTRKMIAALIMMSKQREWIHNNCSINDIDNMAKMYSESRKHQIEVLIEYYSRDDVKNHASEIQKNHYNTHPERRVKHSKFMTDYWNKSNRNPSEEMKEYCKNHPEKQQKQSKSMKKHYESQEARDLTGKLAREYYKDEKRRMESKEYMRCRFTAVDKYTLDGKFIKTFECVQEAADEIGIKAPNIFSCINGKQKSAGGFVWKRHNR